MKKIGLLMTLFYIGQILIGLGAGFIILFPDWYRLLGFIPYALGYILNSTSFEILIARLKKCTNTIDAINK